jgi:CRISPR-associated protein Csd2
MENASQSKTTGTPLTNKIDFAVIFRVLNANPNGDPLNGNRPRVNYDGLGEVSDVCIKRKIRNRLIEKGVPIFVQSDDGKVDSYPSLRSRADSVLTKETKPEGKARLACQTWFDVRTFGQLFAFKATGGGKAKTQTTGEEADDKGVSIGIRGPVSVQSAFSLIPVSVSSIQITKSVSGEGDGKIRSSDTMGMKHRVDQGVYAFYGSMNPQLASRTGFSDRDAETIKEVLPRIFENDASSARPEGSMEVLKVIWWRHNCPAGQVSSAKVHRSLKITPKDNLTADISFDDIPGLKPEVINGY